MLEREERTEVSVAGVEIDAPGDDRFDEVLTAGALDLLARLHRELDGRRHELLRARQSRQAELDAGGTLGYLPETREVREGAWEVAPPPADLTDRRCEITGPTDRKMVINALGSGARGYMADFEDATSPKWSNLVRGQVNLSDAVRRTISHLAADGTEYRLAGEPATLIVRPRGLHLPEKHVTVDGQVAAGAFFDFALFVHRNATELLERGSGPYLYLPKLESHREARLWNDAICVAQDALGIERGSIRATVLIETVPAAFEMEEILYELRQHSAGLNAGRWDYIFSMIKRFRSRPDFVLPDRAQVTMTVPFMRAYTEQLVRTCHRRGAHAIGGMAAFIPSRRRPEINEQAIARVREDKRREAGDGFDGTWVAHPDLVAEATDEFDRVLGDRPNQVDRRRDGDAVAAEDLLDVPSTPGAISEQGLRSNVNVGIQYISSWLRGNGAAAIHNLMEDAATAEIARAQVWQWVRHGARLDDGQEVTAELTRDLISDELERIRAEVGDRFFYSEGRPEESRELFERVALSDDFVEFLTLPAYERID
jgi:malate synthase